VTAAAPAYPPTPALVALDWGTTALRAYLLGTGGAPVEERAEPWGITRLPEGGFAAAYRRITEGWPALPAIASGMVGSAHGWVEAPYVRCPARVADLAAALVSVPGGEWTLHVVPGLLADADRPDVMRGEETQIAGALERCPELAADALLVLPGTHSKWVRLDGTRVTGFTTAMTGELYGLLLRDSILARLATGAPGPEVTDAFVRGLETEAARGDERGLPALLFTARTHVLAGLLEPEHVADYVSGLLIGAEVRHGLRSTPGGVVALCGPPSTTDRYRAALERGGASVRVVPEGAAVRGLWRVAADAGLAPARPAPSDALSARPAPSDAAPSEATPSNAAPADTAPAGVGPHSVPSPTAKEHTS
jgi:2-dehydro-3-deoxygalactonokinase